MLTETHLKKQQQQQQQQHNNNNNNKQTSLFKSAPQLKLKLNHIEIVNIVDSVDHKKSEKQKCQNSINNKK